MYVRKNFLFLTFRVMKYLFLFFFGKGKKLGNGFAKTRFFAAFLRGREHQAMQNDSPGLIAFVGARLRNRRSRAMRAFARLPEGLPSQSSATAQSGRCWAVGVSLSPSSVRHKRVVVRRR